MGIELHQDTFDAKLPTTMCKAATRSRLDEIAEQYNTSAGSIVRAAVEFFLDNNINLINVKVVQEKRGRPKKSGKGKRK